MDRNGKDGDSVSEAPRGEPGSPAERALAEAAERRAARERVQKPAPIEIRGRDGPEPTRYGDWEIGGLASDF